MATISTPLGVSTETPETDAVATEAIERGATPEQVSAFLGHKSPQTTKKFYATLAVAPKIPTLA